MNILDAIGNTSMVQLRRIVPPGSADVFAKPAALDFPAAANLMLVGATAVIGLITFPILQPAWVFVQ